jgi:predicted MPP superfamily phosphohydrolase
MDALIPDVKAYHNEKPIDLLIFSGDLIDKGGESFEGDTEIALLSFVEKFIDPITSALSLPKNRVIIAPGNHDIDRKADDPVEEMGLRNTLLTPEIVNNYIDGGKQIGIRRIFPFKRFEQLFYKAYPEEFELTMYQSAFRTVLDSNTVGICSFNSAWRCFDSTNDKGGILLGERQVSNARRLLSDCDIRIGIIHHPLNWLVDFDCKIVSSMIEKDYDLFFCGHVHEGSTWTRSTLYGKLFVSIAPSNWNYNLRSTDRFLCNGYTVVDFDVNTSTIITHSRRYSHLKQCFDPNTDLGDANGKCTFYIPDPDTQIIRSREARFAQVIQNVHLQEINEHLLTYYTDTKAPKELDKLFVEPNIISKVKFSGQIPESDTEEKYTIKQLCKSDQNFIIFGTKESGKTTLLDELIVELSHSISEYHTVPIYVD